MRHCFNAFSINQAYPLSFLPLTTSAVVYNIKKRQLFFVITNHVKQSNYLFLSRSGVVELNLTITAFKNDVNFFVLCMHSFCNSLYFKNPKRIIYLYA